MNTRIFGILMLLIAGVIIAGCTTSTPTAAAPAPTGVVTTATVTSTPGPSFSLGDHYLQKSYSFQSENDIVMEQFRVDDPSWGIDFKVTPLNDNLQYCWFVLRITNIDTGQSDSYGYGRQFSYDREQMIPRYTTGPYKVELSGNRVKVDVDIAKRNP